MKKYILALTIFLTLPACVNIEGYSKGADFKVVNPIRPGTEEAVINFYHPYTLENLPVPLNVSAVPGENVPILFKASNVYQIWEDEELVGFLPVTNRCFQVRVKPGKHIFLGRFVRSNAGNWTVLQGNFEAGKTYFVKVYQRWNTWKPSVSFEVLKPTDSEFDNVGACKTPFAYDRTSSTSAEFWDHHVNENIDDVRTVYKNLKDGSKDYYFDPDIKPENGR